jgi:uncharacterized membrane protein YraQ (UPF0718 family)
MTIGFAGGGFADGGSAVAPASVPVSVPVPDPFNLLAWLGALSEPAARALTGWLPQWPAVLFIEAWLVQIIEIGILVGLTSTVLAWVRYRVGAGWFQRSLGRTDLWGSLSGAALGLITPVCSCSVGAIYASLLDNGASLRSAGAFLFAAPATNEVVLLVLLFVVGPGGALLYLAFGLAAAVATGHLAPRLGLALGTRRHDHDHAHGHDHSHGLEHDHVHDHALPGDEAVHAPWRRAVADTRALLRRLAWPLGLGAALAVALEGWHLAPAEVLGAMGRAWFTPIVAALIGLPLHVEPGLMGGLVLGLVQVGVPLGTLISLTMAASVASVPEALVLRSVMGTRAMVGLTVWYLFYTSSVGLLVNAFWRS